MGARSRKERRCGDCWYFAKKGRLGNREQCTHDTGHLYSANSRFECCYFRTEKPEDTCEMCEHSEVYDQYMLYCKKHRMLVGYNDDTSRCYYKHARSW